MDATLFMMPDRLGPAPEAQTPAGRNPERQFSNSSSAIRPQVLSLSNDFGREPHFRQSATLSSDRLQRAVAYINDNLADNLSLAAISAVVKMSRYHFAHAFKQATGISPHQYVLQKRIEMAKQLLAWSDLPLVEIGLQVGFNTQSHFSSLFLSRTGFTPKQYRQRIAARLSESKTETQRTRGCTAA